MNANPSRRFDESPPKQQYRPPEITPYGSVRDITRATGLSGHLGGLAASRSQD